MSTTTFSIHQGRALRSMRFTCSHNFGDLVIRIDCMLAETVNKDTKGFALSNFQSLGWPLVDRNHEILNLFVINFTHHGHNFICFIFVCIRADTLEDLITGHWHDTSVRSISNHRMALSRPCLTISEKTCMETSESIIEHINSDFVKHILLILVLRTRLSFRVAIISGFEAIMAPEGVIECKSLFLFFS